MTTLNQQKLDCDSNDYNNNQNDTWFPHYNQNPQLQDQWFYTHKTSLTINGKCSWFNNANNTINNIEEAIVKSKIINPDDIQITLKSPADHNPKLLQQYYNLRHSEFQKQCGFHSYNGFENDFDRQAKILLIQYQGETIGGARVGFANKGRFLSQEVPDQGFTYQSICQQANIDGVCLTDSNFVEVSGLVIDPNYKHHHLVEKMYQELSDVFKSNKIKYVFGVSELKYHLDYQITLKHIGYRSILLKNFIAPLKAEYNYKEGFPIIIFV